LILTLDHEEVERSIGAALASGDTSAENASALDLVQTVSARLAESILVLVARFLVVEAASIIESDKGSGVKLTLRYPTRQSGRWWLLESRDGGSSDVRSRGRTDPASALRADPIRSMRARTRPAISLGRDARDSERLRSARIGRLVHVGGLPIITASSKVGCVTSTLVLGEHRRVGSPLPGA
jgi:hypothetical protein